jgi:hypothetical protein
VPQLARACVVPGAAIAWDDCCGQLAVAVSRTYLSDNFPLEFAAGPQQLGAGSPCGPAWLVAELAVQVVRCAPTLDDAGNPPSCIALDTSAQETLADAWLVRRAVTCRLAQLADVDQLVDYRVGAQLLLGPEGACVGSQLPVLVCLDNACQCE